MEIVRGGLKFYTDTQGYGYGCSLEAHAPADFVNLFWNESTLQVNYFWVVKLGFESICRLSSYLNHLSELPLQQTESHVALGNSDLCLSQNSSSDLSSPSHGSQSDKDSSSGRGSLWRSGLM